MQICFMCDLHLPFDRNALQYEVLQWAIADMRRKKPDCIIFAGDITCDGNLDSYQWCIEQIRAIDIPFLYIPGNSDLRCALTKDKISGNCSPRKSKIKETMIFALNDCSATVSDSELAVLEEANDSSIVFMHHPIESLDESSRVKMLEWRSRHKNTALFYAHLHRSQSNENGIALQAMDPDKAIGECPCITYYDTETQKLRKAYYFSPVPNDFYDYFGISCYDTLERIEFAIANQLKYLELRPNCIHTDMDALLDHVSRWRNGGGDNLCIHLPDVIYKDGRVSTEHIDKYIEIANRLHADRFTQHVPFVSVKTIDADPNVLTRICDYLAEKLESVDHEVVIGVENMHMTEQEHPNDTRRYGYLPEECITFMQTLQRRCRHKVGINFDIGHARNNIPYSQTYQISTWFSQVGKYVVGYHIHQVTLDKEGYHNHMPLTDIYGALISYTSFFKCWQHGSINKAPIIFEMRPKGAYETTLQTFEKQKTKRVFDIHTHSFYSRCGRDPLDDLIHAAIEHGVSILGITDHNYGIGTRKEEYLKNIRNLAKEYDGRIRILCGIEIATLPQNFDLQDASVIQDYDYCLIEHITNPESIVGGDLFAFCKKLGIPCGIAHTDLFEYCDIYGYDYKEFFASMGKHGIFWEMNVSYDSIHKYHEHAYVSNFMQDESKMKIVRDAGVVISIGSDCHRCEEYNGHRLYEAYDFLKKNGFTTYDELI